MKKRSTSVWVLAIAAMTLITGCEKEKKPGIFLEKGRLYDATSVVTPAIDTSSNPQSCFVNAAWPGIPASDTSATIDWSAAKGDSNTYYLTFTANPLLDRGGHPATMPIVVTSSGTSGGPYTLSSTAVAGCRGAAAAAGCYYSYDMSLTNGGPSCVQHYPGGNGGFDMGVHITR